MHQVALVVNSHHSSEDIWYPFFEELRRYKWHESFSNIYLFSSRETSQRDFLQRLNVIPITYNSDMPYNLQYLYGLKRVKEEYIVTANEDCIPMAPLNNTALSYLLDLLSTRELDVDFIKGVKGSEIVHSLRFRNLFQIDAASDMFFTQQVSIWKRLSLLNVYSQSPTSYIARKGGIQQETVGTQVCRDLQIKGALFYAGESKRGIYHYDSTLFPHICTAIVGGHWNFAEYKQEILNLAARYNLDLSQRGFYACV